MAEDTPTVVVLAGFWEVYNNSATGWPRLIAQGNPAGPPTVLVQEVWDEIQKGQGHE